MKLDRSLIKEMFLNGRMCLKVPEHLPVSLTEYARIVFDIADVCLSRKNTPFIISCYTRYLTPAMYENTCLIADIHYVEFLSDYIHWSRTKDNALLESIYCKYMQNSLLLNEDYVKATFYEWLIKEKQLQPAPFSLEDYKEGFLFNAVALMHEIFHFIKGFDEYDALFLEHDLDKHVADVAESIHEGKCDFMGLSILLDKGTILFDKRIGVEQIQVEIVEKYIRMMAANSLYKAMITNGTDPAIRNNIDRIYATVSFLYGMKKLFPHLCMDNVSLTSLSETVDGLTHICNFIQTDLVKYADEFNALPTSYTQSMYDEVIKNEKNLRAQKEFTVCQDGQILL